MPALLLGCLMTLSWSTTFAGGACENATQYPSTSVTVDAGGSVTTINTLNYEEEYSVITGITSGNYYEVTSSNGGGFITIREGAVDGTVIASGFSPLQFTASSTSDVYIHWNLDAACNTDNSTFITTTIQDLGLPPCENATQYPSTSVTVDAGGAVTSINTLNYEEEFSVVTGITAGNYYEVTSTGGGGYITVREGAVDGPLLAEGFSPVQFEALSSSDVYIHWTVDAACNTDNSTFVTTTIQDLGLPPCLNTSLWPGSAVTPDAGGAVTTIAGDLYAGSEYSIITGVLDAHEYEFAHANGAYVTVRVGAVDGPVLGSGYSPLTVQASGTADLYVHWTVDDACAIAATGSYLGTVQDLGIPPCNNDPIGGIWPSSAVTVDGFNLTEIAPCSFEDEYSIVTGIVTGGDYTFTSANGGGYITITVGAVDGPVLGAGFSPLTVTTTGTEDLYAHWTLDEFCNTLGSSPCVETAVQRNCTADAGTITADASPVCLDGGSATISATPDGNQVVPTGYVTAYVLTDADNGLTILDVQSSASFTVSAGGNYIIHTLVLDPADQATLLQETTGGGVAALLLENGGTLCGSLDVTGAPIIVSDPDAGTITADVTPVCMSGGSATVSATADANQNVPTGYLQGYALTLGGVIEQVGATASFTVSAAGDYTIHTFVYPTGFDPATAIGQDASTVNGLLVQGGGTICAALDLVGATITVNEQPTATISGDLVSCNGSAVEAQIDFTGAAPWDFTLTLPGGQTVPFTGVTDNPYMLPLNNPAAGSYTLSDVSDADGNCPGAAVGAATVSAENPDAGAIDADESVVCYEAPFITVSATPDGNAVVPTGYETIYLLVDGNGDVVASGATASFAVTSSGDYTIHTLVYDPNTLTPGDYSTAAALIAAITPAGSICASLDETGAAISAVDCPDNDDCSGAEVLTVGATCTPTAGSTLGATQSQPGCAGTANDDVWYAFTATAETATVDVQGSTDFDAVLEVFSAATGCGDLVSLACVDVTLDGGLETADITGMTIGEVYYIRVYHWYPADPATPTFDICVYDTPPPPADDEPCGATALTIGANGPIDHTGYSAAGWEADLPVVGCSEQGGWCVNTSVENSQWFSFVAPASGRLTVSSAGSAFDTQLAVYSGTCQDIESGTGVLIGANDDDPAGGLQSFVILCDLTPGETYYVMLDGFGGAEGEATLTLTETSLDAGFTYVAAGLSVEFTDASTASGTITDWAWEFGDGNTADVEGPVTNAYASEGPYTVCLTVTDDNGCTSEYCEAIQVADIATTITEALNNGMSVYPNPSNGEFVIEINEVEAMAQLNVMDLTGRVIYTEAAVLNGNFRKELNLHVVSGTYLLQILTEKGMATRKLQVR